MSTGWLINDKLTCIPGTKTFWHDLLDWLPNLSSKANNIDFNRLPLLVESEYRNCSNKPDYFIRNATFFRKLNVPVKTISLLQDSYLNSGHFSSQIDVCTSSTVTVFNSPFVHANYKNHISTRHEIIPLGTDFNFFSPMQNKKELREKYNFRANEPYIIFIGDASSYPKGFDTLTDIINKTNYNFCLVMKDGYVSTNDRVKVFNKIDHDKLKELINCCDVAICTSKMETLHLAGMECAACNIPLVTTNVGVYYNDFENNWGYVCGATEDFIKNIGIILNDVGKYRSRDCFLQKGMDKESCKRRWINLVETL